MVHHVSHQAIGCDCFTCLTRGRLKNWFSSGRDEPNLSARLVRAFFCPFLDFDATRVACSVRLRGCASPARDSVRHAFPAGLATVAYHEYTRRPRRRETPPAMDEGVPLGPFYRGRSPCRQLAAGAGRGCQHTDGQRASADQRSGDALGTAAAQDGSRRTAAGGPRLCCHRLALSHVSCTHA